MIIYLTKGEFLNIFCIDKLFTKEEFNEKIELYKGISILNREKYPTYEEYLEFYAEKGMNFYELYNEQTKNLIEFINWLKENKDKNFTYDEIENKLLELSLSFDGFNGNFGVLK